MSSIWRKKRGVVAFLPTRRTGKKQGRAQPERVIGNQGGKGRRRVDRREGGAKKTTFREEVQETLSEAFKKGKKEQRSEEGRWAVLGGHRERQRNQKTPEGSDRNHGHHSNLT